MIPPGTCHPGPKNSSSRQVSSVRERSSWMSRSTLMSGVIRLTKRKTSAGSPRRGSPRAASRVSMQCRRPSSIVHLRLIAEIDAFPLDDKRAVADLCVDRTHVLAQDAEKEELHRRNAEQANDERGDPNREVVPEQHLHPEI